MKIKRHDSTWDILRSDNYSYIVRNDLAKDESYCLRFTDAAGESATPEVFNVCNALQGGDHYLGYNSDGKNYKYMIKGDKYLRVADIETGVGLGQVVSLHRDFRDGDFYFQRDGLFYSVTVEKDEDGVITAGTFVNGSRLSRRASGPYTINRDVIALNPLCIWGNGKYYYILCEDEMAGLLVKRTTAISDKNHSTFSNYSVPDALSCFMPGGLAATNGSPTVEWELVAHKKNDHPTIESTYSHTVTTTTGLSKKVVDGVETHWNIKTKSTMSVGILIAQAEITVESEVGQSYMHSESKTWYEEKTVESKISCVVPPGGEWSLYRARIDFPKLGGSFLADHLIATENGEPPAYDNDDEVY